MHKQYANNNSLFAKIYSIVKKKNYSLWYQPYFLTLWQIIVTSYVDKNCLVLYNELLATHVLLIWNKTTCTTI